MIHLTILASGSGTNAEALIRHFNKVQNITVAAVLSNKEGAGVLDRAKRLGVTGRVFSRQDLENGRLLSLLREFKTDYVILAGFLLKIPQEMIEEFPNRILNIHPALLPKYGGKGMYGSRVHEAVISSGEKESGITIHLVNEHYDKGKHLFQARVPVEKSDTPEMLAQKIHVLEHRHFPKVVEEYVRGR